MRWADHIILTTLTKPISRLSSQQWRTIPPSSSHLRLMRAELPIISISPLVAPNPSRPQPMRQQPYRTRFLLPPHRDPIRPGHPYHTQRASLPHPTGSDSAEDAAADDADTDKHARHQIP
mmetsp:Transcript_29349/g.66428  ORF Transcript_29349/g.66428 Transcript_29349/m.66428 type:complete len:120 (-) Transcript_29349:310-669(-)